MANNYLLFSAILPTTTPEQRTWAKAELEKLIEEAEEKQIEACQTEIGDEGIYFYSEESGSVEFAIPLVQAFLKKFDPKGHWSCEFAYTCSKPRPGEFGGGAVLVTAKGESWFNSGYWLSQEIDKLKKKSGKKKSKKTT